MPAGHGLRQRGNGGLPLANDAQPAEDIAALRTGLQQLRWCRKHAVQRRPRGVNRLAQRAHQPLRHGACRRHGDLLAQNSAHRQLKTTQRARHPQPVTGGEVRMQLSVDGSGFSVQIEQGPNAANHLGQHTAQRITDLQHQLRRDGIELRAQPAANPRCVVAGRSRRRQRQSAGHAHLTVASGRVGRHELAASHHMRLEKRHHRFGVIGWPVAQAHRDAALAKRAFRRAARAGAAPPQRGGVEPVMRHKGGIEAAHAGKAAHQRDLRDGQRGVGQQLLGGQQAPRLQVLQRRNAQVRLKNSLQMAGADPEAGRQRRHGVVARRVQQPRGLPGQNVAGVLY